MRTLANEFPQVDQLVIVNTYYNNADQTIDIARQILHQEFPEEANAFGQSVLTSDHTPYGPGDKQPQDSMPIMGVATPVR